jgi:hypothetical protein
MSAVHPLCESDSLPTTQLQHQRRRTDHNKRIANSINVGQNERTHAQRNAFDGIFVEERANSSNSKAKTEI